MKILILSCNTGQGHNSCAAAIREMLIERGNECEIADALSFISENISKLITKVFEALYRKTPKVWDKGYGFADDHPNMFKDGTMIRKVLSLASESLDEYIISGGFDAVVCPHVFPALMLIGKTHIKRYFLATDYTLGPCVNVCDCDGFFIPNERLKSEFTEAGIPEEKIYCTGIPVNKSFFNSVGKAEAKRLVGIEPETRHLLMACGSMGCGPLEEMAELIEKNGKGIRATVICGSNEKLFEALSKKNYSHVTPVGFTDKMSLYMESADLYLSKPGGISVTESAVKHKPIALINAVAGCETANYNFFVSNGAAICDDDPQKLIEKCIELIFDDKTLDEMSKNIAPLADPMSCKRICDIVTGEI